jgi:hypothetical protein
MTFSKKALLNSGARMPIRNAVREKLPDIVEAIDAGASLSGIYRTLVSEGCKVGAGPSSFRSALTALQTEIAEIRAAKAMSGVAAPKPEDRSRLTDDRFTIDWGE